MPSEETVAPLRILIVEDSIVIATRLRIMLSDVAHHEFTGIARNLTKALYLIGTATPDVVILDIHLEDEAEGKNGIDLLRILQSDYPQITVIMFTNFSEPIYREKCMALGASYYYDKTNDFEKVLETIRTISENKRKNNH